MIDLRELFGERYRVVDDGTDDCDRSERLGCQEIRGKHGTIYPYGRNGSLAVRVESSRISARIESLGLKVIQRGDFETVFLFDPKQLNKIAALIQAQKRRQLSAEEKAKLVARLKGGQKRVAVVDSKAVLVPEGGSSRS